MKENSRKTSGKWRSGYRKKERGNEIMKDIQRVREKERTKHIGKKANRRHTKLKRRREREREREEQKVKL